MATIVVTPSDGDFSFNVKYCHQFISIPGFVCEIDNPEKMIIPLRDFGCDNRQISSILFMIYNFKEGEVDENGEIKDFEEDDEDEEDDDEKDVEDDDEKDDGDVEDDEEEDDGDVEDDEEDEEEDDEEEDDEKHYDNDEKD